MAIGIDIGRVIIGSATDNPTQFFDNDYLATPEVEGAFYSIEKIVNYYQPENVFLVSKCGEIIQSRTIAWLKHNNFYRKTNFAGNNIKFCRKRSEKKNICHANGIRIFIDDRYSILSSLMNMEKLFLFNPTEEELLLFKESAQNKQINLVFSWQEIINELFS